MWLASCCSSDMLDRTFSAHCDSWVCHSAKGFECFQVKTKTEEENLKHVSCLTVTMVETLLTGVEHVYGTQHSELFWTVFRKRVWFYRCIFVVKFTGCEEITWCSVIFVAERESGLSVLTDKAVGLANNNTGNVRVTQYWVAFTKRLLSWKSNKSYIFLCMCARVRLGARAWACSRVALLIQDATRRHIVFCDLSGSIFRHYLVNGTIFGKKKCYRT